jgi:hypothetical protein
MQQADEITREQQFSVKLQKPFTMSFRPESRNDMAKTILFFLCLIV